MMLINGTDWAAIQLEKSTRLKKRDEGSHRDHELTVVLFVP
jgi:hypothetical protein